MEAAPKVHRQRHRRSDSRHSRRSERQPNAETMTSTTIIANESSTRASPTADIAAAEEGVCDAASSSSSGGVGGGVTESAATTPVTRLSETNERQSSAEDLEPTTPSRNTPSQTSSQQLQQSHPQQTVVLVNGHAPPQESLESEQLERCATTTVVDEVAAAATPVIASKADGSGADEGATAPLHIESPTQPQAAATGGGGSSRNSSGDALSLRETLQQLPATLVGTHHHRHRRTHSPQSTTAAASSSATMHEPDASFHRGILGFMDRELKQCSPTPSALSVGGATGSGGSGSGTTARKLQSLSDPQASPAQRSIRSRSSLEKSPRRKRSKSESRRRRERKLIAAGEMEVRQANETLMRYLKQCSEMNDASLSGELEIDQNFDERRVHRKTKSQRDKRGHLISKLYTAGGLSSLLKELSDDIIPAEGEEIYNPFTPVVSPTEEDTPAHIDKMFLQTSSGYRPVEHGYYKHSFVGAHGVGGGGGASGRGGSCGAACGGVGGAGGGAAGMGMRTSGSYGETRCLLDADCRRHEITSNIQLACVVQRIWLLISNICHGLLAGLALAHLLFVLSSHPVDWSRLVDQISLAGETSQTTKESIASVSSAELDGGGGVVEDGSSRPPSLESSRQASSAAAVAAVAALGMGEYAAFAEIYLNTFYCLVIVCLVSVFDRMDICRWDLSNASELVSFRWLIIAMIYIATIILTLCSDSIDERLYYNNNANVTLTQKELLSNSVLSVWSSLAVTRSIGAICGWIMIGLTPHEDLLYEHLVDLTKYQMTNN